MHWKGFESKNIAVVFIFSDSAKEVETSFCCQPGSQACSCLCPLPLLYYYYKDGPLTHTALHDTEILQDLHGGENVRQEKRSQEGTI